MGKCAALVFLLFVFSGCSDKQAGLKTVAEMQIEATPLPSKGNISAPAIVKLDTCPAPQVISLFSLSQNSGSSARSAADGIEPHTISPLVFSANVTTYGAEQGLYSQINTIKKDRNGNFWFGTGGGGIIRYDGKTTTSFTTAQGLATNNIRCITEDKNGNLWIGTHGGGASYYNGRYFTKLTTAQGLSSNNMRGIIVVGGNTWFATSGGGVSIYDGRAFTYLNAKNGLASDNVNCIMQARDGTVWCGTDSGISCCMPATRYDAKQVKTYTKANGLAANRILSITEDKNGYIWLGTAGGGMSYIKPGEGADPAHLIKTYTMAQGLPDNTVNYVFEDSKGKIWLCTANGISSFSPSRLVSQTANAVTENVQEIFTTYNTDVGLSTNRIECAAEDAAGNLWFGTDGCGANRLDEEAFKISVAPKEHPRSPVICIDEDKSGKIWLSGSNGGISCYEGNSLHTYHSNSMPGDARLTCMLQDRTGHLWFGTNSKYVYRDGEQPVTNANLNLLEYSAAQGLSFKMMWCLAEDRTGRIWMGTDAGIYCYDGKQVVHYTTAQGLGSNIVWCSLVDRSGDLWFGTFGGGLSKFVEHPADGGPSRFINYTTAHGLASNSVKSMSQDRSGNIWLGTGGGGISRFDGHSFINYTTLHGLTNNIVVGVSEDKNSNIWLGTNEGFSVLKGYRRSADVTKKETDTRYGTLLPADNNKPNTDIDSNYTPVFEQYNFKTGFPINDVNTNSMHIDTSGTVWAGSANKLVKFDYGILNRNSNAPKAFINAVQVGGKKICWYALMNRKQNLANDATTGKETTSSATDSLAMINEEFSTLGDISTPTIRSSMYREFSGIQFDSITSFYPLPVNLVLPYKNNNIAFDCSTIELARPGMVRYQYKLEGYDEDWSPVTDRSNVSFGNIHEGTYTFRSKARSPDGIWSEAITYQFEVLPPVYRTWWAYAVYCILGICFVYLIVHFRIRILKKENLRLEMIVSDRTAQIEREKAAVQVQANDLKKLNQFKDKTFSILSHDLRGPINNSTAVISMLNEGDITGEEFKALKDVVHAQLTATGALLDNLLRWAKGSMEGDIQPHPQRVDLYGLIIRNITLFKERLREKNISFRNDVPENVSVWCDAEHIDIVLRNLLANAIKFTTDNGSITISTTNDEGMVRLTVTDTGVGMTEEQLNNLFKPIVDNTTYGTAGEKGTGLGLLLSYEFIKANKGRIEISSKKDNGTTVTVVLPVA